MMSARSCAAWSPEDDDDDDDDDDDGDDCVKQATKRGMEVLRRSDVVIDAAVRRSMVD
jgi:hypothetical protein